MQQFYNDVQSAALGKDSRAYIYFFYHYVLSKIISLLSVSIEPLLTTLR
jgi:hypothetical protein